MQCPRCRASITALPDPGGFILCPGCGVRLMTKADALRTAGGTTSAVAQARPSPAAATPAAADSTMPNPVHTLPPGTPLKKIPRPGEDTARSGKGSKKGEKIQKVERVETGPSPEAGVFDRLLEEIQAVREVQEQILSLLRSGAAGPSAPEPLGGSLMAEPTVPARVRSRVRKTVLLIDDDPATREAAEAEFRNAEVPVRAVADANAGIQAIAEEKPDVIALELSLQGAMSGNDVINQIKATMEWVDIPIILYTRVAVESQKEARQVHGADDLVLKRSGPKVLVSRIITVFRRPS
jgi:CheY-like chemotaxis protein